MGWQRKRCIMHNSDPRRSFPFPSQRIHSIVQETCCKPGKVAGLQLPFQQGRVGQKNILNYSAHVGCSAVRSFGTGLPSKITSCETWGTTADTVGVLTHKTLLTRDREMLHWWPQESLWEIAQVFDFKGGGSMVARLKLKGSWGKGATRSIALSFCS